MLLIWLIQILSLATSFSHQNFDKPLVIRKQSENGRMWSKYDAIELKFPLFGVYESNNKIFPYYDTSIGTKYQSFIPEYEFVDLPLGKDPFCKEVPNSPSGHNYLYYSGNTLQPEFNHMRDSILDPSLLIKNKAIVRDISSNVWIGEKNVKATAHYDNVNNVYLQILGSKRFRLLPPKAASQVQFYGRHHPYACQSRFSDLAQETRFENRSELWVLRDYFLSNLDNVATATNTNTATTTDSSSGSNKELPLSVSESFLANDSVDIGDTPIIASSTADHAHHLSLIEVVLQAGDVLLIPPYWTHEAEALSCSMSVSHWWDAKQLDAMDRVFALPLPLESSWDTATTTAAVFVFLSQLVQLLHTETSRLLCQQQQRCYTEHRKYSVRHSEVIALLRLRYSYDWSVYQIALNFSRSVINDTHINNSHPYAHVSRDYYHILNRIDQIVTNIDHLTTANKINSYVKTKYMPAFIDGFVLDKELDTPLQDILKDWRDEFVQSSDDELYGRTQQGEVGTCSSAHSVNHSVRCSSANNSDNNNNTMGDCDNTLCSNVCNVSSSSSKNSDILNVLENRVSIMHIKVCDYIEDIFLHIAANQKNDETHNNTQSNNADKNKLEDVCGIIVTEMLSLIYFAV